ncbi:MAG: SapC family protein [Rubrivivax sp.]
MIHPSLYRKPVMLDARAHRDLKVARTTDDWSVAQGINSIAVAALEFADVAVDFPIVFVRQGDAQGRNELVPVAVFGLTSGENLYVQGSAWRVRYVPALLRMYPFGVAGIEEERVVIAIDEAWPGWSRTEGEPVFDAAGEPSERTRGLADEIGKVAGEVLRGPELGQLLADAGLLMDTRFEATTPAGEKIPVDGFYSVDSAKLAELDDAKAVELFRNGAMALIHAHQISMRNMTRLVQWRAEKNQAAQAAAAAPAAS